MSGYNTEAVRNKAAYIDALMWAAGLVNSSDGDFATGLGDSATEAEMGLVADHAVTPDQAAFLFERAIEDMQVIRKQ